MKRRVRVDFVKLLLRRDTLGAFLLFLAAFAISARIDGFERIAEFLQRYDGWHFDEAVVAFLIAPFSITFVAVRILGEAQQELELRKAAEAKVSRMAMHDPLTGLPNRRYAEQAIAEALPKATHDPFAVLLVDLNRYRSVNDLHGHVTGDLLLLEAGKRLENAAGESAFVGRLGSDEFIILLRGAMGGDGLYHRVQRISQVFDDSFLLGGISLHIGASIGITLVNDHKADRRTVLTHADAALSRCKERAGNGFAFFEPGMELAAMNRAEIEIDLHGAIQDGRIVPYYQPLVDLETGEVEGFEVLARWLLADGTLRQPGEFIPIAEQTGQISELFFSLLQTSMEQVRDWPAHYRYTLNLSPIQLGDQWLVERILQILLKHGIAPGRLDLEITESAIVDDIEAVRGLIARLKSQGISVTLDDFGTGYSSLRHLGGLDFDSLKIDKSFITDIVRNPASQTIVRSVTALAHSLGLRVIVEGVETLACADTVRRFGCDVGQGYLFGRPEAEVHDFGSASERFRDAVGSG